MKLLREIFDFYIDSSIHVSIAVLSLQAVIMIKYCSIINNELLLFTFFSTLFAYNFIKYAQYLIDYNNRISNKLKAIIFISIISLLLSLFLSVKLSLYELIITLLTGIITFLYAIPFFVSSNSNLRGIKGLKIYVVGLVWTLIIVLLPLEYFEYSSLYFILANFIQIYLYVLIAIIPFEIRDIEIDDKRLSTIPQKIGVKRTKIIGLTMILAFVLIELLKISLFNINSMSFDFILVVLLMVFMIFNANEKQKKYYSSFWVEGLPIIWVIILFF
tara:strand:+ start:139 stop:957 length:819 start_codon:yes stop_codon:yes gene_type:complete